MATENDDYDSPWKDILEEYLKDFMTFFFPAIAVEIDWEKGYTSLDKEFQKIVRDSDMGRKFTDKLIKVWKKNGEEKWVLIHIEVQAQFEKDFAKRMYIYGYRIFDRYNKHPVSLAILADDRDDWRPDRYSYESFGYNLSVKFPCVKLLDYGKKWEALESFDNPFSIVVMAHLKTMETKGNNQSRKDWKINLLKHLYSRGYKREYIVKYFSFIDWIMKLPEDIEEIFWKEFSIYEEEKKMPYVTSVEKIGIKKGIQQGLAQGLAQGVEQGLAQGVEQGLAQGVKQGTIQSIKESVIDVLELRFGMIPEPVLKRLNQISDTFILKMFLKKAVTEPSIESFRLLLTEVL